MRFSVVLQFSFETALYAAQSAAWARSAQLMFVRCGILGLDLEAQ